jgi:putative membrane protein
MKTLMYFVVSALAIFVTAYILPGVTLDGVLPAFVLAVILGAINAVVRPVLIFLTLPLTVFSFGLFIFVINGLLVMLASVIVPGFSVANFWWALLFSIVLTIVTSILGAFERR